MGRQKYSQFRIPDGRALASKSARRQQPDIARIQATPLLVLQNRLGNRSVQRLLAQRSGGEPFTLDDETAQRINRERSGGRPLDGAVQAQMGQALGANFSAVRIHTSLAADDLNRQLEAKAFTTGQDVFFRGDAYSPGSSGGQELIAHELTHVVQQSSGAVGSSGAGMTVNAPGDRFEQEADAVAKTAVQTSRAPDVQRQDMLDEEEDELQTQRVQREEFIEDDELETGL